MQIRVLSTSLAMLLLAAPALATSKSAGEIHAPRRQELQAPGGQDFQAPRGQDAPAHCDGVVETFPPRGPGLRVVVDSDGLLIGGVAQCSGASQKALRLYRGHLPDAGGRVGRREQLHVDVDQSRASGDRSRSRAGGALP